MSGNFDWSGTGNAALKSRTGDILTLYSETDEAESESDGGFGADSESTLSRKMRRKAKEANVRKKAASGESLPLENNNNPDSEA